MQRESDKFRNLINSDYQERVERLYLQKNAKQTYDYALSRKEKYTKQIQSGTTKRTIMEAVDYLNNIVDESDPDNNQPQIQHAMQTAEACREARPNDDWFHLVGFIHDLGKVIADSSMGGLEQWEVVGDTFPVGCAFSEKHVFSKGFAANPDSSNPKYSSPHGIYSPGCGLKNIIMAWGHDEYLHLVLRNYKDCSLPEEAYNIIRFHSFYPWHNKGEYKHLMDEADEKALVFVNLFQKCDLYSKSEVRYDYTKLKPYYESLVQKYIPGILSW